MCAYPKWSLMALRRLLRERSGLVTFGISALILTVIAGVAIRHFAVTPAQRASGNTPESVRADLVLGVCLGALYLTLLLLARRLGDQFREQLARREEQVRRDPLTSLPNREQLHDLVHQAIVESGRNRRKVALMLMDLNRFKEINDTLGHHTGDRVLQQLATRLRNVLRESETVARFGGDEFAILL